MISYAFTGYGSSIVQSMVDLVDDSGSKIKHQSISSARDPWHLDMHADRYVFCGGYLAGKSVGNITQEEITETVNANFANLVSYCDELFKCNSKARVCIVGSMSGYNGSFDMAYAMAKAGVHLYAEHKKISKYQHLVAVAPTIIGDAGMTLRRMDHADVEIRAKKRRLGRWLTSKEVAVATLFALEQDSMCNTVVKLTGGNY